MDPQVHRLADDDAPGPTAPEALRIQVAAIAAQQIAVDEEECRIAERRTALEHQQEHFAAHVEEKRRQLVLLSEQVQAERAAVQQERQSYERHIERITGDLSQPQREILDAEKHTHAERQRLSGLVDKLKRRWHRHWKHRQQQYIERQRAQVRLAESLDQRQRGVEDQEADLRERRLRFNGEAELSRLHLKEAWGKLRRGQFRWKHRRGLERAALRVRTEQVEAAAQRIAAARAQLDHDQRVWQTQRQALELELDGVNARVQNQRATMNQQEARLRWLEEEIYRREQTFAALAPLDAPAPPSVAETGTVLDQPVPAPSALALAAAAALVDAAKAERFPTAAPTVVDAQRVADLDRLAEELADQRRQLVEAWERMLGLHDQWHAERAQAAAEMEALGQRLLDRDLLVQAREQASIQAEDILRQRHEELAQAQHQLIAWGTQLRIEENAWTTDKTRILAELESKDAAGEQHQTALVELRQRWAKRRKREVDQLECQRIALGAFRKEIAKLRLEVTQRVAALDEEKRLLAEKALALEQYREQVLARSADDPQAERRLERLRRRWLTHNAEAIRQAGRERTALQAELRHLEQRYDALERRASEVAAAETELMEKQTAWEQQQVQTESQRARLEHDLQHAHAQRLVAEQQLVAMRDEVERIARALLDQPDPPSLPLEQAA